MNYINYKPKKKKCKQCSKEFLPYVPLQIVCSPACALEFNSKKQVTKRVKEMKKALVTHQSSIQLLQTLFNTSIRLRDRNENCISCGGKLGDKFDAGHFFSCGAYPNLRFNEDNVHAQCVRCNQHLHGNIAEYAKGLLIRIGQDRFDKLYEERKNSTKLSIPEIAELITLYKQKINAYKNPSKTKN